jgi:membrane protein required for colicin V production
MNVLSDFDYIVLAIIAVSVFLGTIRGFMRSFFSLFNIVIAIMGAYNLSPYANEFLKHYVGNSLIAKSITPMVCYVVVLSILSFIFNRFVSYAASVQGGFTDSLIGMLFGLLRGILICTIIFGVIMHVVWLVEEDQTKSPEWLAESKSTPYLQQALNMFINVMPERTTAKLRTIYSSASDKLKSSNGLGAIVGNKAAMASIADLMHLAGQLPDDLQSGITKDLKLLQKGNVNDVDRMQQLDKIKAAYSDAFKQKQISQEEYYSALSLLKELSRNLTQDSISPEK